MGIKQHDRVPPGTISPITPPGKDVYVKAFLVSRTDTVASVKAMLPAAATVIDIWIVGVASDAVTTANISIGTSATATEWVSAQDVKTAGGLIRPTASVSAANLPNMEPTPWVGDISVYAKYAETGTASTVGGPYTVFIMFVA